MRTFLKAVMIGSAPAFAVTCILGAGMSSGNAGSKVDPVRGEIIPLDGPGTQPSTQPSTQPTTRPTPPIRRRGGGGGGGGSLPGRGLRG
jgi:hypothetical protein